MLRAATYCIAFIVNLTLALFLYSDLLGQAVRFDCPAVSPARQVHQLGHQRVVEVTIPISLAVSDNKLQLDGFRTEVGWNRNAHPIVSYGPATTLLSPYEGLVTVEKKTDSTVSIGAKVSNSSIDFLTPSVDAGLNKRDSETRRYNEIPERELVVGSGPIKRGTGAYFLFKPSKTAALEGGRELVVAFEVPQSWRAGVLQITMQATGSRTKFGVFQENFDYARVFVMPIFLEHDDQARHFAYNFASSEQQLRQDWTLFQSKHEQSNNQLQKWFTRTDNAIPELWMHHLIQSGSDTSIERFEHRLPKEVARSANQFVEARRNLIELSR